MLNIEMINFSSIDQSQLRNSMILSGLDVIKHNVNRKKIDLKLFEFGKIYHKANDAKYNEIEKIAIFIYGPKSNQHWSNPEKKSDYYFLKGIIKSIIEKLGFNKIKSKPIVSNNISEGEIISYDKSEILSFGLINKDICKFYDLNEDVFYAEIDIDAVLNKFSNKPVQFERISKYPEVTRDLSILIDSDIKFENIYKASKQINKKLIKEITLFDVYEGKNLPKNKKSYGLSFKIQDNDKTLSDSEIESVMTSVINKLEKEFNAELR